MFSSIFGKSEVVVIPQTNRRFEYPKSYFREKVVTMQVPLDDALIHAVMDVNLDRDVHGNPIFDEPDLGYHGYGEKFDGVWQYQRDGSFNPLFVQKVKARDMTEIIPSRQDKEWVGYDPNFDEGIDFGAVVLHYSVTEGPQGRGEVRNVLFDAPDSGTNGPRFHNPSTKKEVFKFDNSGGLNPLFLQIRKSQVKWQ